MKVDGIKSVAQDTHTHTHTHTHKNRRGIFLLNHQATHRVLWLPLGIPVQGEGVREALAGTTEEVLCWKTAGGQKNLHAALKSMESAEYTQAMRGTEDSLLAKCVLKCLHAFLLCLACITC